MEDLLDDLLDFERLPLNIGILFYVKTRLVREILEALEGSGYQGCCQSDPSVYLFRFYWLDEGKETKKNRGDLHKALQEIASEYVLQALVLWPVSREHIETYLNGSPRKLATPKGHHD